MKRFTVPGVVVCAGSPLVRGAWIEKCAMIAMHAMPKSPLVRGAWIENLYV